MRAVKNEIGIFGMVNRISIHLHQSGNLQRYFNRHFHFISRCAMWEMNIIMRMSTFKVVVTSTLTLIHRHYICIRYLDHHNCIESISYDTTLMIDSNWILIENFTWNYHSNYFFYESNENEKWNDTNNVRVVNFRLFSKKHATRLFSLRWW
jgi:hypothetical protein